MQDKHSKPIMRKITLLLSCFVLLSAFTCENEPLEGDFQSGNPNNNTTASFSVDFDGQTFVADQVSATILEGGVMNITGLRGAQMESVIITLFGTTEGVYELGVTNAQLQSNAAAYSEASGSSGTWVALTDGSTPQGQVTITDIDENNMTISGTFSFTAYDVNGTAKEFTNGVFTNIPYVDTVPSGPDNSFFAKVDGVEFNEDTINGTLTSIPGLSTIGIVATRNNLETISLTFDSDITPGDYDFAGFGGTPVGQYNLSTTDVNVASGTFTITTHDTTNNRIVGTFEFTTSPVMGSGPSYTITEGSFDVTYTE